MIILDYLAGLRVSRRVLTRGKQNAQSEKEMRQQKQMLELCGQEPRNVGGLSNPEEPGGVYFLRASRWNAALLTPCYWPNETDF